MPPNPLYAASDPLDLFVDEMSSEEPEVRIGAMRKLKSVALAIGKDKTKRELLAQLASESERASWRVMNLQLAQMQPLCIGCSWPCIQPPVHASMHAKERMNL